MGELQQGIQNDRQVKLEDQVVKEIFRVFGISPAQLVLLVNRVTKGTAERKFSMDWFNAFADFPVKFGARAFVGKRKLMGRTVRTSMVRQLRSRAEKVEESEELQILADTKDAHGDESAAVFKYPDWEERLVLHDLDHPILEDEFRIQRQREGRIFIFQPLDIFLRHYAERWDPHWII